MQYVGYVGSAERVYALGVVAHYADVFVTIGQSLYYQVLRMVGVLVLVHQYVSEPFLVFGQHFGKTRQQFVRPQEQVVEVHRSGFETPFGILLVHVQKARTAGGAVGFRTFRVAGVGRSGYKVVFKAGNTSLYLFGLVYVLVELHVLYYLRDKAQRVVRVVDGEVGRESQTVRFGPQYAGEYGVERAHPKALGIRITYDGRYAFLHFTGGFVGKCQGQYVERVHAFIYKVCYSVGQHARFAGSGSRYYHHRAFGTFYRRPLYIV